MSTITTLRDWISAAAKSHKFDQYDIQYLLPDAVIRLASFEEVHSAIFRDRQKLPNLSPDDIDDFAKEVSKHAGRMFLMCIYAGLDMAYLQRLLHSDLNDASIKYSSCPEIEEDSKVWPRFWTVHWILEPTKMDNYTFGKVVPNGSFLPIIFDLDTTKHFGIGSCGKVYKAQFLKQYCGIQQLNENQNDPTLTELCALKKFETGTHARRSWENESDFAAWLASCPELMNNPHITKTFLGFKYRDRRYLVSELAEGSLDDLLDSEKTATHDLVWLRKQMIGLTRALSNMHGPKQGKIGSHNDIQPANILVFPDQGNALKFTDWGATKLTETVGNSTNPPCEDILYLGSVFMNLLIWFYDGKESLKNSYAFDWFVVDPLDPDSGMLKSNAQEVFDDLRERHPNILGVIDVIHDMVNGESTTQMKASEALRRFEAIPEPW